MREPRQTTIEKFRRNSWDALQPSTSSCRGVGMSVVSRYRENAQSPSWQKPPGRPVEKFGANKKHDFLVKKNMEKIMLDAEKTEQKTGKQLYFHSCLESNI